MKSERQDDELLRSYLLGELPEQDADRLERRLLAEDDLFELAEAVEADLLAAVDRGGLAPEVRERVLRRLASSPQGRERLALARSLNVLADGQDARTGNENVKPFLRRAPAFPPPPIHWMALAACLILLAGLGWFAWQHRGQASRVTSQVAVHTPAPAPQPPAPAAAPTPQPASPPVVKPPRPAPGRSAPPKEPRQVVLPAVVTLSLMTSRGAGAEDVEQLRLSPGTRRAEVQIDAGDLDDAKSFSVVIRQEQVTVWQKSGLKVTHLHWGPALVADVPARFFAPGRYEVAVTAEGESERSQVFEVVRGKS